MLTFYVALLSCLLSIASASATSKIQKLLLHENLSYQKYLSLESKLNDDDQKRYEYLGAGKRKIWAQTVKDLSKVSSAHHLPAKELLFDAIEIEDVSNSSKLEDELGIYITKNLCKDGQEDAELAGSFAADEAAGAAAEELEEEILEEKVVEETVPEEELQQGQVQHGDMGSAESSFAKPRKKRQKKLPGGYCSICSSKFYDDGEKLQKHMDKKHKDIQLSDELEFRQRRPLAALVISTEAPTPAPTPTYAAKTEEATQTPTNTAAAKKKRSFGSMMSKTECDPLVGKNIIYMFAESASLLKIDSRDKRFKKDWYICKDIETGIEYSLLLKEEEQVHKKHLRRIARTHSVKSQIIGWHFIEEAKIIKYLRLL
jgi:hypothetical protein